MSEEDLIDDCTEYLKNKSITRVLEEFPTLIRGLIGKLNMGGAV